MPEGVTVKRCSKCGEEFPATPDYFSRHGKGLRPECKACRKAQAAAYYLANRDAVAERNKHWREDNPDKDRQAARRRHEANPDYNRERQRQWRQENPEKYAAIIKRWRDRHREHYREYDREYRGENREKIREQQAKARAENRQRFRAYNTNRRAMQLAAGGTYSASDIERLYAEQDGLCRWCSEPLTDGYEIDHVIPLSRGGSNSPENLAVTCSSCNRRKSSLLPFTEWQPPRPL